MVLRRRKRTLYNKKNFFLLILNWNCQFYSQEIISWNWKLSVQTDKCQFGLATVSLKRQLSFWISSYEILYWFSCYLMEIYFINESNNSILISTLHKIFCFSIALVIFIKNLLHITRTLSVLIKLYLDYCRIIIFTVDFYFSSKQLGKDIIIN